MRKTKPFFILTIFALFLMAESKAQNNTDSRPLMMMGEAHERSSHERPEQNTTTRTAQERRDAEISDDTQGRDNPTEIQGANRVDVDRLFLNQDQLTLDHFQEALEDYPEAERLIIVAHENGTCSIEPQAEDPNNSHRNNDENMQVIKTLRTLIPPGVADDLLQSDNSSASSLIDPLSAPRLREILERVASSIVEVIGQTVYPDNYTQHILREIYVELLNREQRRLSIEAERKRIHDIRVRKEEDELRAQEKREADEAARIARAQERLAIAEARTNAKTDLQRAFKHLNDLSKKREQVTTNVLSFLRNEKTLLYCLTKRAIAAEDIHRAIHPLA